MATLQSREFTLKTGEKIMVRSVIPDDTAGTLQLASSVLREGVFMITEPDEFQVTEEQEREWLQEHADDPCKIALVALARGTVVGILNFSHEGRRRLAHSGKFGISVHKEWRGKGVGRALLQTLLDWAESSPQIEKVNLEVFANNGRAIHLYQKLGFVEEGRSLKAIKIAPGNYVDLVLMSRFVKEDI